jgi:hypothetical protein
MKKLRAGDRVLDETTHERGSVVHVFPKREMGGDHVVAVLFDGRRNGLAIPADALKRLRRG